MTLSTPETQYSDTATNDLISKNCLYISCYIDVCVCVRVWFVLFPSHLYFLPMFSLIVLCMLTMIGTDQVRNKACPCPCFKSPTLRTYQTQEHIFCARHHTESFQQGKTELFHMVHDLYSVSENTETNNTTFFTYSDWQTTNRTEITNTVLSGSR